MGSHQNIGAWDWSKLMDNNMAARTMAWSRLINTPCMACMVPMHGMEVHGNGTLVVNSICLR